MVSLYVVLPKMTARENEALARRFVDDVWNNHNLDAVDELFSPDYVGHWFEMNGVDVDREGVKTFAQNVFEGFPDYGMDIEYIHADDEMVTVGFKGGGSHEGEFYGIPPTGKPVEASLPTPGIMSMHVQNGQFVEGWAVWDALGMLQDLEIIPSDFGEAATADD
jgi:predicted ester cyclase